MIKSISATVVLAMGTAVSAATPETRPDCVLHVWPSQGSSATTSGVMSNLGLAGAYADYRSNRDSNLRDQVALIVALPPTAQAQVLARLDIARRLGMDGARLRFEGKPIDPRVEARSVTRLSSETNPCYAELVVTLNHIRQSAVRGTSLKTSFTFRDFRSKRPRIFSASGATPLRHFPPRSEAREQEARREVAEAFGANLVEFTNEMERRRR